MGLNGRSWNECAAAGKTEVLESMLLGSTMILLGYARSWCSMPRGGLYIPQRIIELDSVFEEDVYRGVVQSTLLRISLRW